MWGFSKGQLLQWRPAPTGPAGWSPQCSSREKSSSYEQIQEMSVYCWGGQARHYECQSPGGPRVQATLTEHPYHLSLVKLCPPSSC